MEFSFGKSKRQSISLHSIRKILWCTSFKNHFYVNIKILWPSIVIDFFSIYIFFYIYFVFWYTLMKKDGRNPYMIAMRPDRNRSKRLKQYCFKLFWRQIIGDCSSFSYTEWKILYKILWIFNHQFILWNKEQVPSLHNSLGSVKLSLKYSLWADKAP